MRMTHVRVYGMKRNLIAAITSVAVCTTFLYFSPEQGRYATDGSIFASLLMSLFCTLFFAVFYLIAGLLLKIYPLPEWTKLLIVLGLLLLFGFVVGSSDSDIDSTSELFNCLMIIVGHAWLLSLSYGIPFVIVTYHSQRRIATGTDEKHVA